MSTPEDVLRNMHDLAITMSECEDEDFVEQPQFALLMSLLIGSAATSRDIERAEWTKAIINEDEDFEAERWHNFIYMSSVLNFIEYSSHLLRDCHKHEVKETEVAGTIGLLMSWGNGHLLDPTMQTDFHQIVKDRLADISTDNALFGTVIHLLEDEFGITIDARDISGVADEAAEFLRVVNSGTDSEGSEDD